MTDETPVIRSRDNALVKQLRRLVADGAAARRQGRAWLEGDHLCRAALHRGVQPELAVFAASEWAAVADRWVLGSSRLVLVDDALFASLSTLESPARMGFVVPLPEAATPSPGVASVVLDGLQDPGNVGAILRCASAFGFRQVLAMKGTTALWGPKVLRAGMGAHFALQLLERLAPADLADLNVPLLATSSHRGDWLHRAELPWPCAWILGHEGQGVGAALEALADRHVRIAQPGGEESLNVATAAAICMHASAVAHAPHA